MLTNGKEAITEVALEALLPQRRPMLLLDAVLAGDTHFAVTCSIVRPEWPLAGETGVDALVLFNRFYQPDIDLEKLDVSLKLELSSSSELLSRLRWTALLSGRVDVSLGVTGGVHTPDDALKAVMAGAHGVQVVSAVLKNGVGVVTRLVEGLDRWLAEHEYASLEQAQGSMSLWRSPRPEMYERGNYIRILQGYSRSWR